MAHNQVSYTFCHIHLSMIVIYRCLFVLVSTILACLLVALRFSSQTDSPSCQVIICAGSSSVSRKTVTNVDDEEVINKTSDVVVLNGEQKYAPAHH